MPLGDQSWREYANHARQTHQGILHVLALSINDYPSYSLLTFEIAHKTVLINAIFNVSLLIIAFSKYRLQFKREVLVNSVVHGCSK